MSVAFGRSVLTGVAAVGVRSVAGADFQSTPSAGGTTGPSGGTTAIDVAGPGGNFGSGAGSGITPGTWAGIPLRPPPGMAPGVVPLVEYQVGGTAGYVPVGASGFRPGVGVPYPYHFHAGVAAPGWTISFGIGLLSLAGTTNVFSPDVNRRSGSYQGAFLLLYVGG